VRARFRADTLAKTGGRCAVPGCTTPTDRVQAHHAIAVTEGGSNDGQVNGVPLCHAHHREVERWREPRVLAEVPANDRSSRRLIF
jgi:hypothetical protein